MLRIRRIGGQKSRTTDPLKKVKDCLWQVLSKFYKFLYKVYSDLQEQANTDKYCKMKRKKFSGPATKVKSSKICWKFKKDLMPFLNR